MNFLSWPLTLSFIVCVAYEAVVFHKATVCRQRAWIVSAELITHSTLEKAPPHSQTYESSCGLVVSMKNDQVRWYRLPHITRHIFELPLKGKL